MSIQNLLQQLLQSGQGLAKDANLNAGSLDRVKSSLSGFGGGALTGGAIGLLLGNKKFRKVGGKLAAYGGVAALGAVAFRTYQEWQKQQTQQAQPMGVTATSPQPGSPRLSSPQLSSPQAYASQPSTELEQHSRAILAAMIGAAKADGHIGDAERQMLETELAKLSSSAQDRQWLEHELAKPTDPAQIASLAVTPEIGAEIYLASLLIIDEDSFMERAYLDELARQLKLDPALQQSLKTTVQGG
jgi:uncharacterized membrane protein YebE (DUF533 family)